MHFGSLAMLKAYITRVVNVMLTEINSTLTALTAGLGAAVDGLSDHLADTSNPHEVPDPDHGALPGLSDDDHTQYSRADGSRAFTAVVAGVTPTADEHLATKSYADGVGGASDHGGLSGLGDDDHTQYARADGSRGFTAVVSGVTPTADAHLSTKKYADDLVIGGGYVHPNHSGDVHSVADGAQTIQPGVVTYAKMQNVSADERLLGRNSAGFSVVDELTPTEVLGMLNVTAGADVTGDNPPQTHTIGSHSDDGALAALDTVSTTEIDAKAVTYAKIQDVLSGRVLGRTDFGDGVVEELSAANVLSIIGVTAGADVTGDNPPQTHTIGSHSDEGALATLDTVSTTEIDAKAVTYAKIQDTAASTILGRGPFGVGVVTELSASDVRSLINVTSGADVTGDNPPQTHDMASHTDEGALATLGTVDTDQIDALAVTLAKVQHIADGRILGNDAGFAASPKELTGAEAAAILGVQAGADVTGDNPPQTHDMASHTDEGALSTLNTVGTTEIDAEAVTYAKIQDVTHNTFLGRVSFEAGPVGELSVSSALGLLGVAAGADVTGDNPPQTHTIGSHSDEGALATLNTVGTTEIDAQAVTYAKIQNMTDQRILGNTAGFAASPAELTGAQAAAILGVAAGADVTGDNPPQTHTIGSHSDEGALATLNTVSATEIDDEAVTLAKMADMAQTSFLGRGAFGAGVPTVLSASDARSILNVENGATAVDTTAIHKNVALEFISLGFKFTTDDADIIMIEDGGASYAKKAVLMSAVKAYALDGILQTVLTEDEGTPHGTPTSTLDFVGDGVTATQSFGTTTVTVPGGSQSGAQIKALYELETSAFTDTQFTKLGTVATGSTKGVITQDGGVQELAESTTLNFTGSGVVVSSFSNTTALTITDTDNSLLAGGSVSGDIDMNGNVISELVDMPETVANSTVTTAQSLTIAASGGGSRLFSYTMTSTDVTFTLSTFGAVFGDSAVIAINPGTATASFVNIDWGDAGEPTLTPSQTNYITVVRNPVRSGWDGMLGGTGYAIV